MQPFQYKLIMAKCFHSQLKAPFLTRESASIEHTRVLGYDFLSFTINSTQFNFAFFISRAKRIQKHATSQGLLLGYNVVGLKIGFSK